MNHRKLFYGIIIFGFFVTFLLQSCGVDEHSPQVSFEKGELVSVTIGIGSFGFEETTLRNAGSAKDTAYKELGNGYIMEAVLEPVTQNIQGRAANIVKNNTKILVFSYRNPGENETLYKKEEAVVDNGKISLRLPAGEEFKLVLYSYNNSTDTPTYTLNSADMEPSDEGFFPAGAELSDSHLETYRADKDVMWAQVTTGIIAPGMKIPDIEFIHLFSQANLTLTSTTADVIEEVVAGISPDAAFERVMTDIKKGTWTLPSGYATPGFEFGDLHHTEVQSVDYINLIPNENNDLKIDFPLLKMGDTYFYNNFITFADRKLARGYQYRVKVRLTKPEERYTLTVQSNPSEVALPDVSPLEQDYTSGSNIEIKAQDRITIGSKVYKFLDWSVTPQLLFPPASAEITITMPPADIVLTANYITADEPWITTFDGWAMGDLVYRNGKLEISSSPAEEGPAFLFGSLLGIDIQTGNVIFKPEEYTGTADHARNAPYIKTVISKENSDSNDIAGMTDPAQGIGDICLYASQKWPENFGYELWRQPTNNEFKNDLGKATYSGNPVVYTFTNATGGSMQMYCWGYWYGVNGSVMWRGTYGPRWTATMTTRAGNYGSGTPAAYVVALGSGVYPDYPWGRNSAFNVRCVKFSK